MRWVCFFKTSLISTHLGPKSNLKTESCTWQKNRCCLVSSSEDFVSSEYMILSAPGYRINFFIVPLERFRRY